MSEFFAFNEFRIFYAQVCHATRGDASLALKRVDENDELNIAVKGPDRGTVAGRSRLQAFRANLSVLKGIRGSYPALHAFTNIV